MIKIVGDFTMIRDLFETNLSLKEAKGDPDVDGVSILGKVKGNFFFPGGVSRNNRYYSESLWEKVLMDEDVVSRMNNRNMFGTIGHETALTDETLLEGKFSHFITSLSINEDGKSGTGEALILGTPAGRVLHTLLSAKCKLYVSSRAEGKFKGENKGIPAVDPDSYKLQTFDFVVDPGFLEANPSLIESLKEEFNQVLQINDEEGDINMSKELLEILTKQKIELEKSLEEAIVSLDKVKNEKSTAAAELNILKAQVEKLTGENTVLAGNIANMVEKGIYNTVLSTSQTVRESLDRYKVLGTPEAIKEAIAALSTLMTEKENFVKEVGPYEEVGITLKKAIAMIEGYKALGTPEHISEQIRILKQIEDEKAASDQANRAKEMADLTGAPFESVMKLVKTGMRDKEIKAFFENLKGDKSVTKFKKKESKNEDMSDKKEKDTEKVSHLEALPENRGSRLMRQFTH